MAIVSKDNLKIYGSINEVLDSSITSKNTFVFQHREVGFSLGFGAGGAVKRQTIEFMGELLTLPGKIFYMPSKPVEEAAISTNLDDDLYTPFNVNLGNFDGIPWNQPENSDIKQETGQYIENWIQHTDPEGNYPLYGFVYLAKIERIEGSWLKKLPLKATKPSNGLQIRDASNMNDYFVFDSEEFDEDCWVVTVGVALDSENNKLTDLNGKEIHAIYRNPGDVKTGNRFLIHEHGVLFRHKETAEIKELEDLTTLITEENLVNVKHILDNSLISNTQGVIKGFESINSILEP